MKKINIFLIAFLGVVNFVFAQQEEHVIAVSPDKMNVFYTVVDNPVTIAVSGIPDENIVVEINQGTITFKGKGEYNVKLPRGTRNIAKLDIYEKSKGNKKLLGTKEFRIKNVPDPTPLIAGKSGGLIKKEELINAKAIIPMMMNMDFQLYFNVKEFDMTTLHNSDTLSLKSNNNRLTDEMINVIEDLNSGDKIYFENIKIILFEEEGPRIISPMYFKIE
jgi:hypothetical protein